MTKGPGIHPHPPPLHTARPPLHVCIRDLSAVEIEIEIDVDVDVDIDTDIDNNNNNNNNNNNLTSSSPDIHLSWPQNVGTLCLPSPCGVTDSRALATSTTTTSSSSSSSMFSPQRRDKSRPPPPPPPPQPQDDSSHLPKGDCRYILLHPEVKGLRCACVGFALNRAIPGSTCDCGHQACYHAPDTSIQTASLVARHDMDALTKKIEMLEAQLDRQRSAGALVERLANLEDLVDKTKAETEMEMKGIYRSMSGLWQNVGLLTKRTPYYDDHIEGLADEMQRMRNRLVDIDDASMSLEDRVEALEKSDTDTDTSYEYNSRRRKASTPPSPAFHSTTTSTSTTTRRSSRAASPTPQPGDRFPFHLVLAHEASQIQSFRERVSSVGSGSQAWTVHISLLPTSSQPFPFEKDTAAYKRCLSRGLHQVIVIPDTDSMSFRSAVDEAFARILRGRSWQALAARLCDAKNLRGLPMLRKLEDSLVGKDYDVDFLQQNCAVNDESGKILDLYIAMSDHTISWAELRDIAPYKPGLEASWNHDPFLDGPEDGMTEGLDTSRPAAGDLLPAWSPTLKRGASEISRTPSFGSTAEGEKARSKLRRPCNASVEVVGRHAEAV